MWFGRACCWRAGSSTNRFGKPSDLADTEQEEHFALQIVYLQTKATAANDQQWLRQAQPLLKQHECGSQRLCVQSFSRDDYLDNGDDDWSDDDLDMHKAYAVPADTASTSTPGRKPMQAIAMPRKKAGAGQKQSAGRLRSVRLKNGTKAWRSEAEVAANTPPPRYTGLGDYDKRMKAAGVLLAIPTLAEETSKPFHQDPCIHKQPHVRLHNTSNSSGISPVKVCTSPYSVVS